MKKCNVCKLGKEVIYANGKCRECNAAYMRQYREKNGDKIKKYQQEYDIRYYQENKEQILINKKEYYQEHKDQILEDRKEYYLDNREERLEYNKLYYQNNRDQIIENVKAYAAENQDWLRKYHNEYCKDRRAHDPNFRIRSSVSANITYYLKSNESSKDGESCLDYLPYSIKELREHLESNFEYWMNWDNYGRYNAKNWDDDNKSTWYWQIDHIIPQSKLPYTSMADENFKKCWALSNLKPYSAKLNFLDGVKRVRH